MAEKFISLNLKIAFGGALTFLNAKENKEVVKKIDIEHLLIETDAPYLTPHPYRGKTNEPKYIYLVADEIAKLKGLDTKMISEKLYKNACELFGVEE